MQNKKIPVYFMPGMAASPKIFEHIQLPEDTFTCFYLEWLIPEKKESLSTYAKRMCTTINHDTIVLIGVSFGGVLVQEMSKYLRLKKLIIISSVKTKYEMPKRMQILKKTKLYILLPTQLAQNLEVLSKLVFGKTVTNRIDLYKKYLAVNHPRYLSWAIKNMICWQQEEELPNVVHIHGTKDKVFPIKNIKPCISIEGGTHIMILTKYKWFIENLPKIITVKELE